MWNRWVTAVVMSFQLDGNGFMVIPGMGTLKFVNLNRKDEQLMDIIVLLSLCLLEAVRIHLGKKGSLADHGDDLRGIFKLFFFLFKFKISFSGVPVWLSVILTIPVSMGVVYLLFLQTFTLKLEYILCALMMLLQTTELVFAVLFLFSLCKQPTYD